VGSGTERALLQLDVRDPLHCCRSGFLAEWQQWVGSPRLVMANISDH